MSAELYEFGDVTVDLRRVEIRRAGAVVPLEPKAFDVLRHLVENRDRLVTKDELLDVVWKDTFVTPNVLTRAVAQLRKALGDDAFEARYIETVAKRGYRFIAPVRAADDGDPRAVTAEQPTPALATERAARPKPAWQRWVTLAAAGLAIAGVLGAARLWLSSRDRAPTVGETTLLTPRRLTVASESFSTPAISPDGSAVAYASRQTGTQEIYVAGLAEGSRELPITSDGGGNMQPAFSPDRQWLAYHSRNRGGIWVVPSTGGTPRQVADFGSAPSWSPDNETILFTSNTEGISSRGELWTVRRDGTSLAQLTQAGDPPGGHLEPRWSHDGRRIVFYVGRHQEREVWIVGADGGAPWRLVTSKRPPRPAFSPDDRAVYWVSTTTDGIECLMRLRLSGEGTADGEPEPVLPFQGYFVEGFSIAENGTAVFALLSLTVNLFAVAVDARGATAPPVPLTFDDAINTYPDYGPTGRIAYHQVVPGRPITSWVVDEDGRNKEPLSAGLPASVETPQWDTEANRIFALVTEPGPRPPYLAWVDLATRQLTRIPMSSTGERGPGKANLPRLSPDGQRLAFHVIGDDGVINVWVQRLDGGARRQITFDREAASYPQWSQDGKWLTVNLKRGDDTHVGVVSAEGGPVEQLTFDRGTSWPGSFSPDSDRIAFAGIRQGTWNIYTVSRSTKQVKQLTHFDSGSARFPAWSPRGNRIVFARAEARSSLWTVKLPS